MVYRRILVPLDGSVRAEAILPHVEDLAQRFRAEVVLLLVVEPSTPRTVPQGTRLDIDAVNEAAAEAERYLAELQARFQEQGVVARRLVEYGRVVETIQTVAEREAADLIAMASHGRSGLTQVFYGSVAAGVLQRIDRPLLLIRAAEVT